MQKDYGGVIWTNHALKRMRERGIKQGDAWATFKRPDTSKYARIKKAYVYYKTWGNTKIEVVAKQNDKPPVHRTSGPAEEWLILSVWSKPADKFGKQNKKKSFWSLIKKSFTGK